VVDVDDEPEYRIVVRDTGTRFDARMLDAGS